MSLNQSHQIGGEGVVLFYGEQPLIFYDGCELSLKQPLKGTYSGRVYLTSHRVIFINKRKNEKLQSFGMPFVYMREVDIKQPVFGANRITGRIKSDPKFAGDWQGESEFGLTFNKGGAIEFGQALIELGRRATTTAATSSPPSYTTAMMGASSYYNCPPPAYAPPTANPYYGFVPQHAAFSTPAPNTLYHVGSPPPYPGAVSAAGSGWGAPSDYMPQPGMQAPNNHNATNLDTGLSASHAAKAAEASASSTMQGGYYFRENPHEVYAQATAPSEPPPYPASASDQSDMPLPPTTNPTAKKNQ